MALGIVERCKIEVWGRLRKLGGGDTMLASEMVQKTAEDKRDATFVRYELYTDRNARITNRDADYELCTYYGQLKYIFVLQVPSSLGLESLPPTLEVPKVIALGAIQQCRILRHHPRLDIHYYKVLEATPEVVDVAAIQCLVGRTQWQGEWAIFDRSGDLARAAPDFED
ncbi:hypothetical protein DFP72DRAFT_821756 [Ephemerocybe angulata]|uniref:Uncharacterized protein n=1 Tax=Ephemerocybe angulata TaxID=980116 RepID=A0A8H6HI41_9AGAR|nr:hypothetical protein DFP72DRAFT_821756 [Tulosesus angulatus]